MKCGVLAILKKMKKINTKWKMWKASQTEKKKAMKKQPAEKYQK